MPMSPMMPTSLRKNLATQMRRFMWMRKRSGMRSYCKRSGDTTKVKTNGFMNSGVS
jgi:hypothetical protein